ncbi:MAG TPA: glycosyltransferase [Chitinophagaceae bacterium]|nr:glycosyltransferase [Chitinophagaceae bacterium]
MERTIIAVFCYKRAAKLKASVEAILQNPEAASMEIIFFSDGYKNAQDKAGVLATRSYIASLNGFKKIIVHEREKNIGSCPNFRLGIDFLTKNYERFIVIEDDLVVSSNYLKYMLDGLDYYQHHAAVFCITGYCFPVSKKGYQYDTIMHHRFCSYGWASWSDRIQQVAWDNEHVICMMKRSANFRQRLNSEGLDLFRTLKKQLAGTISAWDILMQVHVAENKMKIVYPFVSKVSNHGFDQESTNTFGVNYLKTTTDSGSKRSFNFCPPDTLEPSLIQQLKRPYEFAALAGRKLINAMLRLTAF